MKKILIAAATVAGVFAMGSAAVADLPNDQWSMDTQVGDTSNWTQSKNDPGPGKSTWTRTREVTEVALNPAGKTVGTDRFDGGTSLQTQTVIVNNNGANAPTVDFVPDPD